MKIKTSLKCITLQGYALYMIMLVFSGCKEKDTVCGSASGLTASDITNTAAKISWTAGESARQYSVDYKAKSSPVWISEVAKGTTLQLIGLSPKTEYEWKAETNCDDSNSDFVSASFTTLSDNQYRLEKKWRYIKNVVAGTSFSPDTGDYAEFLSDGSYNSLLKAQSLSGTWSIDSTDTYLSVTAGATLVWTIDTLNPVFMQLSKAGGDTLAFTPF